ncbi:MAG: hypothetical protein AB7V77_04780 [Candidatus Woesearchaeota archaeon]
MDNKVKRLRFRLTEKQYELLEKLSKQEFKTVSEYVRLKLFGDQNEK